MKRNSFLLVISLIGLSLKLGAQTRGVEFYLYNSEKVRLLESSLQYQILPMKNSQLALKGQSSWENRLNFNQDTKKSLIGSDYAIFQTRLMHRLFMDYESYFDSSDLNPSPYINRTGNLGYQLNWTPVDSLSLGVFAKGIVRNEQDRYIMDSYLKSNGYQYAGSMRYALSEDLFDLSLDGNYEQKKLDWESSRSISGNTGIAVFTDNLWVNARLGMSFRDDDLFNLVAGSTEAPSFYAKSDTQRRNTLDLATEIEYYPSDNSTLRISETYYARKTRLDTNLLRNNGEFLNQVRIGLNTYLVPSLSWNLNAAHSYGIKDFSYAQNTRHTENRTFNSTLAWEYSEMDSLLLGMNLDLQRTYFPRNDNKWDNDLLNRSLRLGWKHYYHDRIRLKNWINYSLRDDIYTNALLSANNHVIYSLSLLPEMDFLIGDRMMFHQGYYIRADYTNYNYPEFRQDKLYRQVGCKFLLTFDSYPYIARSQDAKWLKLPFRSSTGNAVSFDLGYNYEENQYATKVGEWYEIQGSGSKNRKHQGFLTLKRDIGNLYYTLMPQVVWGTWTEYSAILGINYQFNNSSYVEFTLSPYSETLDDLDWRSSVNLNLRF